MGKLLMKNLVVNNTSERVAVATDSNSKLTRLDGLPQDLFKAPNKFKIVMKFQNNDMANHAKMERKTDEHCFEHFRSILFNLETP